MYQVLIVEDESLIRQGLIQSIHWESLHLALAAEAENGMQALAILDEMPIDIILTDMRMPVCDGQTMLQEIEKRKLDCKIIVLSEYSDFSYMRQAIHSHAIDYLLKPIDPENLNLLLKKVAEKLDQKNADIPFQELYSRFQEDFPTRGILACCIQLQQPLEKNAPLDQLLSRSLGTCPFESRRFSYGEKRTHFCIVSAPELPVSVQKESAYRLWLKKLLRQIQTITPARAGLAAPKDSVADMPEAILEAKIALQFLRKGKDTVHYHNIQDRSFSDIASPVHDRQLTELLLKGKEMRTELFQLVMHTFDNEDFIYLPSLRHGLSVFVLSLERCCQKAGKNVNISSLIGESYLDRINQIEWYHEAELFLQEILDKTFSTLEEQNLSSTEAVLRQVLNTVQTQYMTDLSLISFSQQYHINYIYLGRRFKEFTGETFTNYLMQVRMEKARQFIEQGGFQEKDVAQMVGYSNPYYFISSYRKYFNQEEQTHEENRQ